MRYHLFSKNIFIIIFLRYLIIINVSAKVLLEKEVFENFQDNPIVEIPDGKVLGTNHISEKGTYFSAFRGIPYAQPPVGELRFASPLKNSNWTDYWDATNDSNICVQGSSNTLKGSEDCLYINVYVPQQHINNEKLAVLVWLHGGAFTSGDSTYQSYSPDYLLDEEVIFVSFNYRLGIFGFLSTEDKTVSGNWGLKDQILALKWIKKNIAYFGGNSSRITIFGESAGAASVSYLVQIPQAQGLFNAAIIQSGSSLNLWALTTRARQVAFQVGYNLLIPALTSKTLLKKLRKVDSYKLQNTALNVLTQTYITNPLRGLPWAPCIEKEGPEAVFTKKSDDYLRSGEFPSKVPIMIGFTSNEAGHAHGLPEYLRTYLVLFDLTSLNLVPYSLTSNLIKKGLAATRIRLNFYGLRPIIGQFYDAIKFINVDQFTRGIMRMTEDVAPFVPSVYFYVFGYVGQITGENPYDGAGHAEELFYLFKQDGEYSKKDVIVRTKLVKLWTNFAKTFNPTPKRDPQLDNLVWPKLDVNSTNIDFV